MTINKLFKRFLKDENLYGSYIMKEMIKYMEDFNNATIPFNAFEWETTIQGHDYWFSKEIRWLVFLYKNYSVIDDKEKCKYRRINSEEDIVLRMDFVAKSYCHPSYDFKQKHSDALKIIEKYSV